MKGILSGMVCVITGASRGIGKAIAIAYAKENAKLILCSRDKTTLDQVASECMSSNAEACYTMSVDLSTVRGIQLFTDDLKINPYTKHGVDVLVNNAGIFSAGGASSNSNIFDWAALMNVNVLAPMYIINSCTPYMIEKNAGTIINIGSIAGVETMTIPGVYSASKWAINGFSHHCQVDLKRHNIKVMVINPAYVATDMIGAANVDKTKVIQPEDIAEIALLPFKTSPGCCPETVTVRIAGNVEKKT